MGKSADSILNRFSAKQAAQRPVAQLHHFRMVNQDVAHVVVSFPNKNYDHEDRLIAVRDLLEQQATVVEGSFREVERPGDRRDIVEGFVTANPHIEPMTDDAVAHMVTLGSNIFMDPEDESVWQVRESENGQRFMCRTVNEDISELLASARSRDVQIEKAAKEHEYDLGNYTKPGQYAAVIDPTDSSIRFGYVLSNSNEGVEVYLRGQSEVAMVHPGMVVEVADLDNEGLAENAGLEVEAEVDREKLREYYQQLYAHDPDYYAEIERIINDHAFM